MAVEFAQSQTKENLMRAFAGESQARNRYTIAAEEACRKGFTRLERFSSLQRIRRELMPQDFMSS